MCPSHSLDPHGDGGANPTRVPGHRPGTPGPCGHRGHRPDRASWSRRGRARAAGHGRAETAVPAHHVRPTWAERACSHASAANRRFEDGEVGSWLRGLGRGTRTWRRERRTVEDRRFPDASRPVARAVSGARSRTSPLAPPRILDRRFGDALGGVAPRVARTRTFGSATVRPRNPTPALRPRSRWPSGGERGRERTRTRKPDIAPRTPGESGSALPSC